MSPSQATPKVFALQQITRARRTFKGPFMILLTQAEWSRVIGRTRIRKVAKFPVGGLEVVRLPGGAGLAAVPRCPPGQTPYVKRNGALGCFSLSDGPPRGVLGPCRIRVGLPALCLGTCSTGDCRLTVLQNSSGGFWIGCVCR